MSDFDALEQILIEDPGQRGIAALLQPGDLKRACQALNAADTVVLLSGFFIADAHTAETDGPPGTLALGVALRRLGKPVTYLTDDPCAAVFRGMEFSPLEIVPVTALGPCPERLLAPGTAWVAIERLGRAVDGKYYTMRGRDISAWTAPLDEWFSTAQRRGLATIGVGDGGNEIGMGTVQERVERQIALGGTIGSMITADQLIVAGTSNWGAWGLIAGLAILHRQPLLPDSATAKQQLQSAIAAGAVDGRTRRRELTVDGLPWEVHAGILQRLAQTALQSMSG